MKSLMNCPLCNAVLIEGSKVLICPNLHGELVTGGFIAKLKGDEEKWTALSESKPVNSVAKLACPNCSNLMDKVDYNGSGIFIDSCKHCPYRWLDAGELRKIDNNKPQFTPEDMLYVTNFNTKLKELNESSTPDNNPKLPLLNITRAVSAGDSRRTLGTIGGMALFGIVTGMIKSRFLRYLIPLLILFFALAFYLIVRSFPK